jgi:formylglycine-generating enzyme required for sulfatase activity
MAGKIFINYRRKLNLVEAQLLKKVLLRHFGKDSVFLDVSGLEGGQHWLHTLEAQVDAAAAMVSLIPKGWADLRDETGARRLDNPDDFVRFEIARAFSRRIPFVPLLLDGASMPGVGELPLNLVQLSFQQGMLLRGESFDDDGDKIGRRLKELIAPERKLSYWAAGAIAGTALLAGLASGHSVLTGLGMIERTGTDDGLRAERDAAHRRAGDAEAARKEAGAKVKAAVAERDKALGDLKAAREELGKAQAKGGAGAAQVEELSGQLGIAQKELKDARAALAKAEVDLKASNGRAEQAEAASSQAQRAAARGTGGTAAAVLAKAGEPFKDCANCPEMVTVPAGDFTMGAPKEQLESQDDERPQHDVTFAKPFAVGRFAVTFAQWDACANDGGCGSYVPKDGGWGRGDQPVINVNWNDAQNYMKWLSEKTGKGYRLLTEAEREYVTRAGKKGTFWWGPSISPEQANYNGTQTYNGSSTGKYRRQTVPVKSFDPNPWGLYQVHGNVWEWVEDCWHADYHNAPVDGTAWTTGECKYRVLRGGSWNFYPQDLRAARRFSNTPDSRNYIIGFRVALGWQDLNR